MNQEKISSVSESGKKTDYQTRMFFVMLEIIPIFGLPAVGGYFLGEYLEKRFEISAQIPLLFGTFIFSWILFIVYFRHVSQRYKKNK